MDDEGGLPQGGGARGGRGARGGGERRPPPPREACRARTTRKFRLNVDRPCSQDRSSTMPQEAHGGTQSCLCPALRLPPLFGHFSLPAAPQNPALKSRPA